MTAQERVVRLRKYGYNPIHIIGPLYLVRNYSRRAKKLSLYGLMIIK